MFWQLSTARMEVLDDGRRRRYRRSISLAATRSSLHIARCGAHSNRRSQATIRSPLLKPNPGLLFVRRHVREPMTKPDCASVSGQAQIRQCTTRPNHHAATATRLSEVDASGDALSAPIHRDKSNIDARNGQAYHSRKTTHTNGTRPAVLGARAGEEHGTRRRQRRRFTPRVRPRAGAPGRTGVLRTGTEAAVANDSMR